MLQLIKRVRFNKYKKDTTFTEASFDITFRLTNYFIVAIWCLIIVLVSGLLYRGYIVAGLGANVLKNQPLVYTKTNGSLLYTSQLTDEPVVISTNINWDSDHDIEQMVKTSSDKNALLYLTNVVNGNGDLYLTSTAYQLFGISSDDNAGVCIAQNVLVDGFDFTPNSREVIYQTGENQLYIYKNEQATLLCGQIADVIGITDIGVLYYSKPAASGSNITLCKIDLATTDATEIIIATDINHIFHFYPNGNILYGSSSGDSLNPWNVYCYSNGEISEKAMSVYSIYDANQQGDLFFSRQYSISFDPFTYFVDSYEQHDITLQEPDPEDFTIEIPQAWGQVGYQLDEPAYDEAMNLYADKVRRDQIRDSLYSRAEDIRQFALYYVGANGEVMLDQNISKIVTTDTEIQYAVYIKDTNNSNQSVEVDKIKDAQSALEMLDDIQKATVEDYYFTRATQQPWLFATATAGQYVTDVLVDRNGVFYRFCNTQGSINDLMYLPFVGDSFGFIIHVDENVAVLCDTLFNNHALYIKVTENSLDLMHTNATVTELLQANVPLEVEPVLTDNNLFYYTNYSDSKPQGDLIMHGFVQNTVGDEISDFYYRTRDYIYTLNNVAYQNSKTVGELYVVKNDHQTLIDRDVAQVLR